MTTMVADNKTPMTRGQMEEYLKENEYIKKHQISELINEYLGDMFNFVNTIQKDSKDAAACIRTHKNDYTWEDMIQITKSLKKIQDNMKSDSIFSGYRAWRAKCKIKKTLAKPGDKNFGKKRKRKIKRKKVSKRIKKLCKKHKIRLTVTRGGKRIPKSEKVLIKQLKRKIKF